MRVKVTISQYETLPAGRMWLHQAWSGDLIGGVISYLPKGTPPTVLSYWFQPTGGPIFNDCICVAANAEKPVIAHRFLNYLLDNDVAYENFVDYVGYQPPITAIDADKLFNDEILPPNLRNTVVSHEDYANGNAYLTLSADGPAAVGPQLGHVPERVTCRPPAVGPAHDAGRRLAGGLLPVRVLRRRLGRPRQRHRALPAGPALEPARLERRLPAAGDRRRRCPAGARGTSSSAR